MQFLEKNKERIILPYTVTHNVAMEKTVTVDLIIFQEIGELVVEGFLKNEYALSTDNKFWSVIIENRIKYINELRGFSLKSNDEESNEICLNLLNWLKQINGQSLLELVNKMNDEY